MIDIQINRHFKDIAVETIKLKKLITAICRRFSVTNVTVSVIIVDNNEIRRINKKFLNHDSITDCLSFNLSDDVDTVKLFELVVNGEMAVSQAGLRGHTGEAELALYITHGLLHNLGFDDAEPTLAKKMHDTEDEILQQLGFGLVYYS